MPVFHLCVPLFQDALISHFGSEAHRPFKCLEPFASVALSLCFTAFFPPAAARVVVELRPGYGQYNYETPDGYVLSFTGCAIPEN